MLQECFLLMLKYRLKVIYRKNYFVRLFLPDGLLTPNVGEHAQNLSLVLSNKKCLIAKA
jgi:hypothetical protein